MKTKHIKILAMISILALGVAFPSDASRSFTLTLSFAVVLFFIGLFVPFLIQYNSLLNRPIIQPPKWSDKLSHQAPLTYTHFVGYASLALGIGQLIGGLIRTQTENTAGILMIALGMGMVIGNKLAVKNSKKHLNPT